MIIHYENCFVTIQLRTPSDPLRGPHPSKREAFGGYMRLTSSRSGPFLVGRSEKLTGGVTHIVSYIPPFVMPVKHEYGFKMEIGHFRRSVIRWACNREGEADDD